MIKLRLKHLRKIAGRIRVEQFYPQIRQILDKIAAFYDSRKYLDLKNGQIKNLGTILFPINGKNIPIEINVIFDADVFFSAGVQLSATTKDSAKLTVNLHAFLKSNNIYSDLRPYIYHEVTHFIDGQYIPERQQKYTETEYDAESNKSIGFFKEITDLFIKRKSKIDWKNVESFNKKSLENLTRNETISLVKSKEFKDLLKKYNLTLNHELMGKLLVTIQNVFIDDMNFYLNTGGNPFGKGDEEIENNAKIMYYNSKTEIKAHINEIIQEINIKFLHNLDGMKLITKILREDLPLSVLVNKALESSNTYKEINKYLYPKNKNLITKEIGKILIEETTKKNYQTIAIKEFGEKLNPQEDLVYRYMKKLQKTNIDKLIDYLHNPKFVQKNKRPIIVLDKHMKLTDQLNDLIDKVTHL